MTDKPGNDSNGHDCHDSDLERRQRAVVFAYHNVGVRCLKVLLAGGVDAALVVTCHDDPNENIWFDAVLSLCLEERIPCITPEDASSAELLEQVREAMLDVIFSFHYRHLLPADLLAVAPAFNMHGSLLPEYRGRAPINWVVLHGATITGATPAYPGAFRHRRRTLHDREGAVFGQLRQCRGARFAIGPDGGG